MYLATTMFIYQKEIEKSYRIPTKKYKKTMFGHIGTDPFFNTELMTLEEHSGKIGRDF